MLGVLGALTKVDDGRRRRDEDGEVRVDPDAAHRHPVALHSSPGSGREHTYPGLWAAWFVGLAVLLTMEVRGGTLRRHALFDHPDVGTSGLGAGRTVVAIVALAFFAALFMPTPISL